MKMSLSKWLNITSDTILHKLDVSTCTHLTPVQRFDWGSEQIWPIDQEKKWQMRIQYFFFYVLVLTRKLNSKISFTTQLTLAFCKTKFFQWFYFTIFSLKIFSSNTILVISSYFPRYKNTQKKEAKTFFILNEWNNKGKRKKKKKKEIRKKDRTKYI